MVLIQEIIYLKQRIGALNLDELNKYPQELIA